MEPRIDYRRLGELIPQTRDALIAITKAAATSGLEASLIELVKIRASQINGCAFCLHMHATDARKQGEAEMRLHLLSAWREAPLYSARERAALAWTEALTLIADTHAPDDVYELVRREFSELEVAALTSAIVAINGWNRIAIAYRFVPAVQHAEAA
ncbi:MAG: carboxymuconolactone decarboxylase family protein [Alphaproteobacteria bacterium]|nr:carboxymuconolactone decarboxylase family protein [Alphaproteobacteria bacterium]